MTFNELDLIAAFDCAEERTKDAGQMRVMVTDHLLGDCPCDRGRCDGCGCRKRNTVPRHEPGCQYGFRKV